MIAFIKGRIRTVLDNYIVVEAKGVGYKVFVPQKIIESCHKLSGKINLHIHHHMTDRSSELYGFREHSGLEVFEMLLQVTGVGPKAALALLSTYSGEDLKKLILSNDEPALCEAPGIGRAAARKICNELCEKIEEKDEYDGLRPISSLPSRQAMEALVELGYNRVEAQAALKMVPKEIEDPQERVKEALRNLGK